MIPVRLKLKGINSYIQEQIIEFDKLLESKIFGIFGEVGSGKSSILEAISYALYGKYDKLKGEKVSYNLMNLKSNRFIIDFEFKVENDKKYRFVVEGRRNSKKFEEVTLKRKYYSWSKNEWIPQEKLDASEIIGLSFKNFNRTIIIPQGRFMEFINLPGKERTKMLKEIFNLHNYDLLDRVGHLQKINDLELSNLEGKLSRLEDTDEKVIKINEKLLHNAIMIQKEKNTILISKEKEFSILQDIKREFNKLKKIEEEYVHLSARKEEMNKNKEKIKEFEYCVIEFKPDLDRLYELNDFIKAQQEELILKKNRLGILLKEIDDKEKEFKAVKEEYDNLDKLKKQYDQYDYVLQLKNEEKKRFEFEKILENLQNTLSEFEKTGDILQKTGITLKNTISNKEKELPDIEQLSKINTWFSKARLLRDLSVKSINFISDKRFELKRLRNSIIDIFDKKDIRIFNIDINKDIKKIINRLESNIENWESVLNDLRYERDDLVLKEKLKEFAHSLGEGKECPVCGSVHHPKPLKTEQLSEDLSGVKKRIVNGENLIIRARQHIDKLRQLNSEIENGRKNIEEEEKKYEQLNYEMEEHIKGFKWENYSSDNPEEVQIAFNSAKKINEELVILRKDLEKNELDKEENRKKQNELKEKQAKLKSSLAAINSKIETLANQLSLLDYRKYDNLPSEKIEKEKSAFGLKIVQIDNTFNNLQEGVHNLKVDVEKSKVEMINIEKNLEDAIKKRKVIETKVNSKLQKGKYQDIREIEFILKQDLDIGRIKQHIEKFEVELQTAKNEIKKIKSGLKGKYFDEELLRETELFIKELKVELESLIEEKSRLKNLIEKQKIDLKAKYKLLKEREEKELRAEDLQLMRTLFTGSGFVNYISTVRLKEVVNYANSRFIKLTRGRLKLELNNDNSFDVIDFLNDGRRRSIKTLSGGQAFQASLSLALSLASIVQQQNKSNQNFFFLDEGFGTQDEDSLRLVFDTIKSLRKENRIAGLISHVAELKEEVSTYLEVKHIENEGSTIIRSWEQ